VFFIIIHPLVVSFLKLTPLIETSAIKQILFFPTYHSKVSSEVFIYLFFIYGVYLLMQYYFFWGLILKYLQNHLLYVVAILFMTGIVFRCLPNTLELTSNLFLPFYFVEIAIGGLVAIMVREKASVIRRIKSLSKSQIIVVYLLSFTLVTSIYFLSNSVYFNLFGKVLFFSSVGFYIIEQTYSKQSITKMRNMNFIIEFGNLSYSFILFAPMIAVMILLMMEAIDFEIDSKSSVTAFTIVCFLLTWFLSAVHKQYIEGYFERIKKAFKTN